MFTTQSSAVISLRVFSAALSFAFVLVLALYLAGFDAVAALRDRSLSEAWEAGLLSDLGIFLVGLAAVSAAFAAWKNASLPLAALSLFCWLFALDDALMIHESFGRYEVILFALYGILAAIVLFSFKKFTGRLPWPICIAFAAFIGSVAVDVIWHRVVLGLQLTSKTEFFWLQLGYVVEDLPKFGGIFLLASCAAGEAIALRKSEKSWSVSPAHMTDWLP